MIVVADTSVLLNLCFLGQEMLLVDICGRVFAPPEVLREFEYLAAIDVRFRGLAFPRFVEIEAPVHLPESLRERTGLDEGERMVLALAVERGIRRVLIDERAGRLVAAELGLNTAGLLGVLLEGKRIGRFERIGPLLDRLRTGARFWISSNLQNRILRLAGELL